MSSFVLKDDIVSGNLVLALISSYIHLYIGSKKGYKPGIYYAEKRFDAVDEKKNKAMRFCQVRVIFLLRSHDNSSHSI